MLASGSGFKDRQDAVIYQRENYIKLIKSLNIPPDELFQLIKVFSQN